MVLLYWGKHIVEVWVKQIIMLLYHLNNSMRDVACEITVCLVVVDSNNSSL